MKSWLIVRNEDVFSLLKSEFVTTSFLIEDKVKNVGSSLGKSTVSILEIIKTWMVYNEQPNHTRLRRFMNQAFARSHIDIVLPTIRGIVDRRFQRTAAGSDVDFVSAFAHPLPAEVLKVMIGLEEIELETFLRWSDSIADFMQNFVVSPVPDEGIASRTASDLLAMRDAFLQAIDVRRGKPRADLLSKLVMEAESRPNEITREELVNQLIHLIFGGHKIPQFVMANCLHLLFQNPEVLEAVGRDPNALDRVIAESMRYESPIQFITRHATRDFELRGKRIKKDDSIFLMLGAANRDPNAFENPNVFAPFAERRNHVAFGAGVHVCIGAALVNAELKEMFAAFFDRAQGIEPLHPNYRPTWTNNATFHGLTSLPIRLNGARKAVG